MTATPAPLRDAHKALTRTRILDAAIELLQAEPLEAVTIARVAAAAGVTERTVYRHFETREALIEALWPRINDRASKGVRFPETPAELVSLPQRAFPAFDDEETLTRSIVFTRQGQALRLSVNARRQAAYLKAVADARPDLPSTDQRRLAALAQLLSSSFAWASMKDYWGLAAGEAGDTSAAAVTLLLENFGRNKKDAP